MLRMATPVAVPRVSSSNRDCSQVRVPSAKAVATRLELLKLIRTRAIRRKKKGFRALCNFIPQRDICGGVFRLSRLAGGKGPQRLKARTPEPARVLILRGIVRFHAFLAPGPAALARL